jgi:uncharacterized repeat protein (TIGR01451 family)
MKAKKNAKPARMLFGLAVSLVLLIVPTASAQAAPVWKLDSLSASTAQPGRTLAYEVQLANVGDADSDEGDPIVVTATLPAGMTLTTADAAVVKGRGDQATPFVCTQTDGSPLAGGEGQLKCEANVSIPTAANSGGLNSLFLFVTAAVDPLATPGSVLSAGFSVAGGGAAPAATTDPVTISSSLPGFGVSAFDGFAADDDGQLFTQAAGHPYGLTTEIEFNTYQSAEPIKGTAYPVEPVRNIYVVLPAGLAGNPGAASLCTTGELAPISGTGVISTCPSESQVGVTTVRFRGFPNFVNARSVPVYNMVTPPGIAARFGFNFLGTLVIFDAVLRPDHRLAIRAANVPEVLALASTSLTFWGNPASASHDSQRACPGLGQPADGAPHCASSAPEAPFLRMPTSCTAPGEGLGWDLSIDSWNKPGRIDPDGQPDLSDPRWQRASYRTHQLPGYPASPADPIIPWGPERGTEGCGEVPFGPSITLRPTTDMADSPTGLDFDLTVPQSCWDAGQVEAICQADVKDATVTQPVGMRVNPATADGLTGCSQEEIGLLTTHGEGPNPIQFSTAAPTCPDSSKIGSVEIVTPLQEKPLKGAIYQAKQNDNPWGSTLAFYAVAQGEGLMIKLPALVRSDPETGQVSTIFKDSPQLPFDHYRLHFDGGPRGPLITPPTCGVKKTEGTFTGWANPGQPTHVVDHFEITKGAGGAPCPASLKDLPFAPKFDAGTVNPLAGAFSPFVLKVSRADGEQELTGLETTLPPGLVGRLAGIPYCPEAAIGAAAAKSGAEERRAPSCPPASRLGSTDAAAGAGPLPFHNPGVAYLAGPYKGAPVSVAIVTPAVAGPLDLGAVVVRAALHIDPITAQVRVVSDPLPRKILVSHNGETNGFPLDLRTVVVQMDRPDFTLNPTSCDPMAVGGVLGGAAGASATVSSRFQVGGCDRLGFKPKLRLRLKGKVRRGGYPSLRATLKMPERRGANIARAAISLPHSEFLAQNHIRTICTRVKFAAGAGGGANCPVGSVYGHARAFSPLLDEPLEGPVFLRSSDHELPDLVAALDGQIHVDLVGRIDSVNEGIRTTFDLVPDAPVSKFVLTMRGGKRGLLENSRNICRHVNRANVLFDAQNGKTADSRPALTADCGRKGKKAKKKGRGQ